MIQFNTITIEISLFKRNILKKFNMTCKKMKLKTNSNKNSNSKSISIYFIHLK